MTLCPARGSHLGSGLYQQLMKSLSDGFISECMGTILNRIPCLPRSPRCIVLSMPSTKNKARHSLDRLQIDFLCVFGKRSERKMNEDMLRKVVS